jgi:hypothetical protein
MYAYFISISFVWVRSIPLLMFDLCVERYICQFIINHWWFNYGYSFIVLYLVKKKLEEVGWRG